MKNIPVENTAFLQTILSDTVLTTELIALFALGFYLLAAFIRVPLRTWNLATWNSGVFNLRAENATASVKRRKQAPSKSETPAGIGRFVPGSYVAQKGSRIFEASFSNAALMGVTVVGVGALIPGERRSLRGQ